MAKVDNFALFLLSLFFLFCIGPSVFPATGAAESPAEEKAEKEMKELDQGTLCRKMTLSSGKRFLPLYRDCFAEIKAKFNGSKPEISKRMDCALKCVFTKTDMITPDGQVSEETLDKNIMQLAEKYRALSRSISFPCVKKFEGKLVPEDEYCKTYGKFVECMMKNMGNLCEQPAAKPK